MSNQSSIASRHDSKMHAQNKLMDAINSLVTVSTTKSRRRNESTSATNRTRSPEAISRRSAKEHLLRSNAHDASLSSSPGRKSPVRPQDKNYLDRLEETPVLVDRLSRSDHALRSIVSSLDRSNNGKRYPFHRHQDIDLFDLHKDDNDDVIVDDRLSRSNHAHDQRPRHHQRQHVERNMMGTHHRYTSVGGTSGRVGDALAVAGEAGMLHDRNRRG